MTLLTIGIEGKSHDTGSVSTIDAKVKAWMVKAAQADYQAIQKMLREDKELARQKDFTSGFTALHWASKHGNVDLVKLLAGTYGVPVDAKSHGGYTPLHLAYQQGHEKIADILVKDYCADPNLRDNSGKKARDYLDQNAKTIVPLFRPWCLKKKRMTRKEITPSGFSSISCLDIEPNEKDKYNRFPMRNPRNPSPSSVSSQA